ncbi:2-keto-4-pentenoate hydratase [Pradoshia sp. D12]|uniref:2-keto-4-pentenoate hydratase n=1 Tax=Bacillaceae TaxID=186817 RepID=UPI0011284903|nr:MULTISPECIES: fumarylacetoacetate hydrolase family protein [Bacillaceae]QFK71907.1 2-keto-4-pentenoate hydratase [Pradoshia sp. D12]TPF73701.1 2-keto-4-pentenoate hydratase [Bacillus sp. D12]
MDIQKAAFDLLVAERLKTPIEPFTSSTDLSVDDAYRIQLLQINEKLKDAHLVGMKIGLTSKVMQTMFNVDTPDFGHILNTMVFENRQTLSVSQFIEPKVEFELAFVLKEDLKGPDVTSEQVLAATEAIVPAIEIIDSRIKNWQFKFQDTVADNGSSAGAVLGEKHPVPSLEQLANIRVVAKKNGEVFDEGMSSAVMGNPAKAVAWLANMLADYDITLKAGHFILAGAITAAVPFESGDVFEVDFGSYGEVKLSFTE